MAPTLGELSAKQTERATAGHGTQICWGSPAAAGSGDNTIYWPVTFKDSNYAICLMGHVNTWTPAYIISKSTNVAHLYLRVSGYIYDIIATGRWK